MLKSIKNALALAASCIQPSSINDKHTLKSFQRLEDVITKASVNTNLYTELADLLKQGTGLVSPENILAAFWLSKIGDERAVNLLLEALASDVYTAQFAAAWGLRQLKESESLRNQLIEFYTKNKQRDFAGQLLGSIILLANSTTSDWIRQEVQQISDELTLRTICRALSSSIAHKDFATSLLRTIALQKPYSVKMAAGCSLALLKEITGVSILLEGLRAANTPGELKWSLMYTKNLSPFEAYQIMIDLLKHSDEDVKSRAIDALGPYGLPDSIDHLLNAISGSNEDIDLAVLTALDWITGINEAVAYDEIEKNYQKHGWLAHTIETARPNMHNGLRYWHGNLLSPSIAFETLATPSLDAPEVAFAQLRFSYGFLFQYEPQIPWVFNRNALRELEHMIKRNADRFKDGHYYMFGHEVKHK